MSELIDRYVHQVGLSVRPRERKDIEAELRSQIQDQLENRYGHSPTTTEIITVLKQLGNPHTLATSYTGEQYLVGPDLYPTMMTVLRFGLPLVPTLVVVANVINALVSPTGDDWLGLLIGSIFTTLQVASIFFTLVVILFAILQNSGETFRTQAKVTEFNPLDLPPVNDPSAVDRFESGINLAINTLIVISLLYFLQVGGLTLTFNPNNPGEVMPIPTSWGLVLLATSLGEIILSLWALLRQRWTLGTWLTHMVLEIVGAVGLYFVLFAPLSERLIQTAENDNARVLLDQSPLFITLSIIVILLLVSGTKLIRLWQYRRVSTAP